MCPLELEGKRDSFRCRIPCVSAASYLHVGFWVGCTNPTQSYLDGRHGRLMANGDSGQIGLDTKAGIFSLSVDQHSQMLEAMLTIQTSSIEFDD
ncbi:hypothetical protein ACTXT7_017225 [Hymenolepis weldensis]